jgi:hypothetical protein
MIIKNCDINKNIEDYWTPPPGPLLVSSEGKLALFSSKHIFSHCMKRCSLARADVSRCCKVIFALSRRKNVNDDKMPKIFEKIRLFSLNFRGKN